MSVLEKLRDRLKRCRIEDASQPGRHFVPKGALVDALQRRDIEQALAQPAFDIPLHAREDDCHIVVESGLVVFATVVSAGLFGCLHRLLEQDVLDQTLPVTDDKLEAIVGEEDATLFAQEMWMFLPLLSSGGRCSRVYKVKIHPEYNRLLRGSGEKETPTFILKQIYPQTQPKSKRTESELLHYLRSLKHENIVELLTSYWLDDVPNLVFRCADCDLGDFLQRPRPPSLAKPRQILNALHGLACGLRHLHDFRLQVTTEHDHSSLSLQGCHHDLKPQNVLVQGSTFILSDFGLSRLIAIDEDSKTLWQYGAREYGAPECRNPETFEVGRVGRASDVWSLGCIALEVLTFIRDGPEEVKDFRTRGRFDGPETTTFSYHHDGNPSPDVEAQIAALAQPAKDTVEAFSTPFLQDMFSWEVLERPVMAVVEPRFGHAAIRTALASLLASVDARVTSPQDSKKRSNVFHAQKSLEVFRLRSWAMALDFLPLDEDEISQSTANESSRDVRSLPSFREIYQLLDNADFSINDQAIRSSQDTTLHDELDDSIDDDLVPELHQLNNRLHRLLSKTESAKADQLFPRLLRSTGDDENLLRAIREEASTRGPSDSQSIRHFFEADLAHALATAQSAYEWSKEALTEDHRETMASMANLPFFLWVNQRYTEAIELQELVTERYEASLGMIHPDTIKCYLNLAAYYCLHPTSQGRAAERMLIIYTKIRNSGLHDHDSMWAMSKLVDYLEPGLLSSEDALEFRQRAFEEGKRLLGEDHPDTWIFAAKLACTLANLEKWDDAQGLFSEARPKLEELLGPSHRDVLKYTISFAEINRVRGKHVAAYDLLRNLVWSDAVETAADQELARDIAVLTATGMLLESQGKDHEAKPTWERVVSITISRGLDSMAYEYYRMARRSLAAIYIQEGNEQKGKEILDELREWTARNLGKDSVDALVLEIDRANQMFESGTDISALELLQGIREKVEAIEPKTHSVCRAYYRSLMHAYRLCDKIEEAVSLAEDYLPVLEHALSASHEDTLKTKNSLAIYYMEAKRYDEAETIWLKLQDTYEQRKDENRCLVIMSNLAWLYNDKGELPDAIRLIRKLLKRRERFSGSRSLDYMDDLYHGAKILGQDPDCLEEAIQMATVYRDYCRSRPPGYQFGARGSWGLGRLLRRMGRNDEALECFHAVLGRSREMVADDKEEWISDAEKEIRELENLAVDSTASG